MADARRRFMRRAWLALGAIAIVVACHSPSDFAETSSARLSNASVVMTEDAILQMASAACARETGCGNIAPGKHFDGPAECTVAMGRAGDAEIGGSTCPSGVREGGLGLCLSELRNLVCAIRLEAPKQLLVCRQGPLCGVEVTP
jgi:hypothetical protein